MTDMEFWGCSFIAFGPPLALFLITIARDPIRIIILISGAFFWLLSLLISSLLWYAVVPLKKHLAFGLVFSVIFQELFRFAFYKLLKRAENGLQKLIAAGGHDSLSTTSNKYVFSYAAGLGYGLMSGAFSFVNVLADSLGPGTVGLYGSSQIFFTTSAFFTLCFVLLHTFWGVIFFHAADTRNFPKLLFVCGSHMLISCLTLLNKQQMYVASLIPAYILMLICAAVAFTSVGGNMRSLRGSFMRKLTVTITR